MKILACDGGGLLGVGQAAILSKISSPAKFSMLAGTSVGSINCALIATKVDQARYMDFFKKNGREIFKGYRWRSYKPLTPKYSDDALNSALRKLFPGCLKDVQIPLFITAADLNRRQLKVFSSLDSEDGALPLWEVIRMAVAAETYFLPWKGYADGGIFANNPAMVAIAAADESMGVTPGDVELCSIGTGDTCKNTSVGSTKNWSYVRWGLFIIQSQLSGAANSMHDFFVRRLRLKKYLRIQFERDADWDMDNPDVVTKALTKWSADIVSGVNKVNNF